jgi:GntR family transcriptional repressor for pyruvate dehydrogenase complex
MRYQPAPIARESVITKAAEEIRRLIQTEGLEPNERLPPETELSRMLGISRNSVREALRILDGLGCVEKQPGRRVLVKSARGAPAPWQLHRASLGDVIPVAYRVRLAIEEKCAELLAGEASETAVAELEAQLGLLREALKRRDFPAAAKAHETFHAALVAAPGNPVLVSMFEPLRTVVAEMSRQGQGMFKHARPVELHGAIVDAVRARDPLGARHAVRRHFRAVASLVEFLSKTPGARGGTSDRATRDVRRGDSYSSRFVARQRAIGQHAGTGRGKGRA